MIVYLEEWSNDWKIAQDDLMMLFDDIRTFIEKGELGSSIKITIGEMSVEEFESLKELEGLE